MAAVFFGFRSQDKDNKYIVGGDLEPVSKVWMTVFCIDIGEGIANQNEIVSLVVETKKLNSDNPQVGLKKSVCLL